MITAATNQATRIRVGDGAEYYAMELAWAQTHRPYMTEKAWSAYAHEYASDPISNMVSPTRLRDAFPALRLGDTSDFNHFWLYSALAATSGKILEVAGFSPDPHLNFLLLHAALCALLIILCGHWHGRPGFVTALFLIFCSPILWYVTKVHTEFFTFSLSTLAIAAVMRRCWGFAALALAVASTQNISFALPAAFCGVCVLISLARGKVKNAQALLVVALLCSAVVVTLLHPYYYFSRYGELTPQLIAGGATLKYSDLLMPLGFIFDPELGLLPNWQIGTVAALICICVLTRCHYPLNYQTLGFVATYLFAALMAQGATTNINSGASIYISRYGLWYICLFFPLYVSTLGVISKSSRLTRMMTFSGIAIFILIAVIVNSYEYGPNKNENYLTPSPMASWIYRFTPNIYNPNSEIFFERNAGIGEAVPPKPSITFGPDCRKVLIFNGPGGDPAILGHSLCGLTKATVKNMILSVGGWNRIGGSHRYVTVSQAQLDGTLPIVGRGSELKFNSHSTFGAEYLISGWSQPDAWGVWSDSDVAQIRMRTSSNSTGSMSVSLSMNGFFFGKHRQITVIPTIDGTRMPAFTLSAAMQMPVTHSWTVSSDVLRSHNGIVDIELEIDKPRSPAELGASADLRRLGIQLTSARIE